VAYLRGIEVAIFGGDWQAVTTHSFGRQWRSACLAGCLPVDFVFRFQVMRLGAMAEYSKCAFLMGI
jgi:hypothetical protein